MDKEQADLSTLNKNSINISTNEEIDLYPNEEYDVVDGFEIKRDYPFPINHTYHGQTKHSERRRLTFLHLYGRDSDDYANDDYDEENEENDHNQSYSSNEVDGKYFVRTYQKFSNQQNQPLSDDDDNDDDNSRENHLDLNQINNKHISNTQHQNTRFNNKISGNHYYYYSPELESTNFISDSEQTFDEDLLKEIDLFEQEFQSMNCS